jgi:hypothetical protein
MTDNGNRMYPSKIIKAGALLADTKTLLAQWNETLSVAENLQRAQAENIFAKDSRSWVKQFLSIFRQRYLTDEEVTRTLVTLVKNSLPTESLDKILFFHSAQADPLLHDTVTEILLPLHQQGRVDVMVSDIERPIFGWVEDGKTTSPWSESTIRRVTQGLMASLRDFGVLQGNVKKRLAPAYLPLGAFAYVAMYLQREQPSGARLINHPEWQLFFLSPQAVERFFVEAHQHRLLEYQAAGSVIRITFPTYSIEDYARVILQGTT